MDIAGELSLKEVGRLNVKEVLSGTRSLCTLANSAVKCNPTPVPSDA